jgi:hypothetical protein
MAIKKHEIHFELFWHFIETVKVCTLERFFKVEENIFVLKTH